MCELCEKFRGDDIWYFDPKNYARQLYRVNRPGETFIPEAIAYREERGKVMVELSEARMRRDKERVRLLSDRLDRLYQENEPCQVIPLRDCIRMLDWAEPLVSMHCVCRKVSRALEERGPEEYSCLGIGTGMLKWEKWPERYRGGVHFMSPEEGKEWFKKWDKAGMVHMIMVYGKNNEGQPYMGGICNCDYPDCQPLRIRLDYDIKHVCLKGHYVALTNYDLCNGCGKCVQRCQFGAIKMEVTTGRVNIDMFKCFGCGVCETGCPTGAISLERREQFPTLREEW